jgi:hypothetical protein
MNWKKYLELIEWNELKKIFGTNGECHSNQSTWHQAFACPMLSPFKLFKLCSVWQMSLLRQQYWLTRSRLRAKFMEWTEKIFGAHGMEWTEKIFGTNGECHSDQNTWHQAFACPVVSPFKLFKLC